jgi:hypothetical protein
MDGATAVDAWFYRWRGWRQWRAHSKSLSSARWRGSGRSLAEKGEVADRTPRALIA